MNKVTAAIKSVNKLGLGAIAIIAIAMMSFRAPEKNMAAQKYAYDQSIPSTSLRWINVDNLVQDNSSTPNDNTYRCNSSSSYCTGYFDTAPTSNSSIPNSGTAVLGNFALN